MNQPLYIAAIAALFFVMLAKHLHHIYEIGTAEWFKVFKQNHGYEKHETAKAYNDYGYYMLALWAFTGFCGGLMVTFFAIWFKATQL